MRLFNFKTKLIYKLGIPITLIIALSILVVITVSRSYLIKSNSEKTDGIIKSQAAHITKNIDRLGDKALYAGSIAANLDFVRTGYRKYYETGSVDSAYKILRPNLDPITEAIQRQVGKKAKIHYHVPPARSLIRSWSSKRGDDISSFRNTVLKISRDHKPISGIEVGRGGFVIRGLSPIFDHDGSYLGSVEILLGIHDYVEMSKSQADEELAIFMHKDLLKIATGFLEASSSNISSQRNKIGNYLLVDKTSDQIDLENLTPELMDKGSRGLTVFESGHFKYGIYPVRDFAGNVIGVSVYQLDISTYQKALNAMNVDLAKTGIVTVIILLLLVTGLIYKLIISKVKKALSFTESIANGDLTRKINIRSNDEIGELLRNMDEMKENLQEIVSSIISSTKIITDASHQLSSSSQEMAEGATEQAASTDEVSASMEEMSVNIEQNSINASETEQLSQEAATGIKEGNDSTQNSVESMKVITDKISIINEIAFQTNILALNAAVEAARAGEHGKGFSVVAEEVRTLAKRSAEAARDIEETSQSGLNISRLAGEKLSEIAPQVEKTAILVQEITSANKDMNSQSDKVNTAIQQLNEITQRNAASSEEMATTAEELSSQANQLRQIIEFFKVDEQNIRNRNNSHAHPANHSFLRDEPGKSTPHAVRDYHNGNGRNVVADEIYAG